MIFVTGANGFVGQALCAELEARKIPYRAGSRQIYGDISAQENWPSILNNIHTVIHLAARVHVMDEQKGKDPLAEFRKTNVEATKKLALAAKASGVKKFIYISSIKVNGEETSDLPFKASDLPNPLDAYGQSKWEAEKVLFELQVPGEFDVVVIRPPLVYGVGVKANFLNLMNLVQKNVPLPFGCVTQNRRSMVSIYNLVDLILLCVEKKEANNGIFLVSDGNDLSLKELIGNIAKVLNKNVYFVPIPVSFMKTLAKCLGKKSYADRLFGNIQVDISETRSKLGWNPKFSFEETFLSK